MRATGTAGTTLLPFGRAWLDAFEKLVVAAPVERASFADGWIQFVCNDADRIRPWAVEVVDGRVRRVSPSVRADVVHVVTHSVTVGWRLLGLSVRGFHRLDELVLEQRSHGRWIRHPLPPLDDALLDLVVTATDTVTTWDERVLDSPIGTLYVSRRLDGGRLQLCGASTRPPLVCEGVASDVAWPDLMRGRQRGARPGAWTSRVWRGSTEHIDVVRAALARSRHGDHGQRVLRVSRDRAFLDALAVLEAMRSVLRGDPRWRDLWHPSARPRRS
jgi:hypothetical protein